MAMNFKTTQSTESLHTLQTLSKWAEDKSEFETACAEYSAEAAKCIELHKVLSETKKTLNADAARKCELCKDAVNELIGVKPNYTPADVCMSVENSLVDYAKRVVTFASTMITTIKRYSANLYDLFVKKLRLCKGIDFSKFTNMDCTMTMVIITYGDYLELGENISPKADGMQSNIEYLLHQIGAMRKLINEGESYQDVLDKFSLLVYENSVMDFLKKSSLVDLVEGTLPTGVSGVVDITDSDRLKKIEQPYVISEAGWTFDKLRTSSLAYNVEVASKRINRLYGMIIDLMEEARRFSVDFCAKEPYLCAALTTHASLIAKQINVFTRVFDVCWNTHIRLVQACYKEEA